MVVGTAHAAHGGSPDASTAAEPIVESWFEDARVFAGAEAGGAAYCDAHVVSAPIDGAAADGQVFAGETPVLSGRGRATWPFGQGRPGGRAVRPLGRVVDWPAAASAGEIAVVIERRPARGCVRSVGSSTGRQRRARARSRW
jgi:hypothetical protein